MPWDSYWSSLKLELSYKNACTKTLKSSWHACEDQTFCIHWEFAYHIFWIFFPSLLNYGAQIWGQYHNCHVKRVTKLKDKAIRIINFSHFRESASKLYKKSKILKFKDSITLNNYLYVHDSLKCSLPHVLINNFEYLHALHDHNTRKAALQCVKLLTSRTLVYGIRSVTGQSARGWNHLQLTCSFDNMHLSTRNVCKKVISQFVLNNYQ